MHNEMKYVDVYANNLSMMLSFFWNSAGVYYIDKTESSPEIHMCRNLPAHREPITCLVNISGQWHVLRFTF